MVLLLGGSSRKNRGKRRKKIPENRQYDVFLLLCHTFLGHHGKQNLPPSSQAPTEFRFSRKLLRSFIDGDDFIGQHHFHSKMDPSYLLFEAFIGYFYIRHSEKPTKKR